MKLDLLCGAFALIFIISCSEKKQLNDQVPLQGTWELISETKIENNDTTFSPIPTDQRNLKILNGTHFSFIRHDLNMGKDSTKAVFVAGAGTYKLAGENYSEHLEFCNFREWENHDFDFKVTISNDTLTQEGREKIEGVADRIIIEKYRRIEK